MRQEQETEGNEGKNKLSIDYNNIPIPMSDDPGVIWDNNDVIDEIIWTAKNTSNWRNKISYVLISIASGLSQFSLLSVQYYCKDILKTTPSQLSMLTAIMFLPFIFKPLFGIISDSLPLCGYKRKIYLLLFGIGNSLSWVFMAYLNTTWLVTICLLFLGNLSIAFSTVLAEAILVQITNQSNSLSCKDNVNTSTANRIKKMDNKGKDNVSVYFIFRFWGMFLSAVLRSYVIEHYDIKTVFIMASALPILIIIAAWIYKEDNAPEGNSNNSGKASEKYISLPSHKNVRNKAENNADTNNTKSNEQNENKQLEADPIESSTTPNEDRVLNTDINNPPHQENINTETNTIIEEFSLKHFFTILFSRTIWIPWLFLLILTGTPSYMESSFYYLTDIHDFKKNDIGTLTIILAFWMIITMLFYKKFLKNKNIKAFLTYSIVISVSCSFLVNVWVYFNIKSKYFVYFAISLFVSIKQITTLPVLSWACWICPKCYEGSIYSVFMSSVNFGKSLSGFFGSVLTKMFGVTIGNYENFNWMIIVHNLLNLLPLVVLYFIGDKYLVFTDDKREETKKWGNVIVEINVNNLPSTEEEADKKEGE